LAAIDTFWQVLAAYAFALAGGSISTSLNLGHRPLCALISLAAGTLLGVTLFSILPESLAACPWWAVASAAASGYADPQSTLVSVVLFRSARRLAFLCDNLGQPEEAIRFYEKAIAAGAEMEELPYSDLGTMLNNVALIFRKSGRQKAAEPYYLHALNIYEKQLGPNHPDVASVLNNLAVFYTNERRYAEAEKIHLRALAIREKALPPTHPDIAQSKCNLAVVYHSRGDYARAAELYRASLESWEEKTEALPEDYEIVASNYADLLRSLGKARKAQQIEARARKRRRG
jgi:tetratricopeptide (TPR) repeat protein